LTGLRCKGMSAVFLHWKDCVRFTEKDEHRTSNVQHRMMNKKTNVEQRMVIEEKDEEAKV
jgi:hypothetical protein